MDVALTDRSIRKLTDLSKSSPKTKEVPCSLASGFMVGLGWLREFSLSFTQEQVVLPRAVLGSCDKVCDKHM